MLELERSRRGVRFTISDIVNNSGLSRNFIYNNFGGRDGLLMATADYLHEEIKEKLQLAAQAQRSDESSWWKNLDKVLDLSHDAGGQFYNYCMVTVMRAGSHADDCTKALEELMGSWLAKEENQNCRYTAKQLGYLHWCTLLGTCLCASCDDAFEQLNREKFLNAYILLEQGFFKALKAGEQTKFPPHPMESWERLSYTEPVELKENQLREQVRKKLRKSGKDMLFWHMSITQLMELLEFNPSEIYEEYSSQNDILDDVARCIWSEVMKFGRLVLPGETPEGRLAEHFGIAVTIMKDWGGSLSFRAIAGDTDFGEDTALIRRNIEKKLATMFDEEFLQQKGTDIHSVAYALWTFWIGCCITIVGDKDFQMDDLKVFGELVALFVSAGLTELQTDTKPDQLSLL